MASSLRSRVRGAVTVLVRLRERSALRMAWLRLLADRTSPRELAVFRTALALVTREGRADVRLSRSISGRYRFTERLSTRALPGRLVERTSLTEIRLRVTRSISARLGPLT